MHNYSDTLQWIGNGKNTKEALKMNEEHFHELVDLLPEAIFEIDLNGKLIYGNRKIFEIFGDDRVNIEDDINVFDSIIPDDRDRALENMKELLQGKKIGPNEYMVRRKDGTVFMSLIHSAPISNNGKTSGLIGFIVDITHHKQIENEIRGQREYFEHLVSRRTHELKKIEKKYKSLVETVIEWIWETDKDGVLTYVSPRIYDIFGYKPEEVIGKSKFELIVSDESRQASARFKKHSLEMKPLLALENKYIHKDGHFIVCEINGFPFFDNKGKLVGYRGSGRDVTEYKKILSELLQKKNDIEDKSKDLQELNTTLKVLLKQIREDKKDVEHSFVTNVKNLVVPYLQKIKKGSLRKEQRSYLAIMESNLNEIASPFLYKIQQLNLSLRETQVANLIKEGKATKEIADIMNLSPATIQFYRKNIREKLNITNSKLNLQSYLRKLK